MFSTLRDVYLGTLCKHRHDHDGAGHSYRHQANATCVECQRNRIAAWHRSRAGKISRSASKRRHAPAIAVAAKLYRRANREKLLAYNRDYRERNPEWYLAYYGNRNAQRRAALLQAMPAWADREAISAIYREAQAATDRTGIKHHVDHIVPLVSAEVCGLHVPVNLRVVPATQNLRKGNRWWPERVHNGGHL